jgi:pimeloyl-ACP methyl ester carboxylesterase
MDRRSFTTLLVSAISCWGRRAVGDETQPAAGGTGRINAPLPTLGGKQFWSDELFFHGWHIQRNALTGHYRLLDERNHRQAWGTLAECQNKLAELRRRDQLPAMRGPAVIVMHGLGRSASSMGKMAQFLRATGKYTVFNVTYPTTRGSIADHALSLANIVAGLDGIDSIYFVAHSLGNLVIRHYLADQNESATGHTPDPRVKRIVMLGPPNNGARLAEVLVRSGVEYVIGKSAVEIRDFRQLEARLCTPACEFAIIAGGRGGPTGYNPWLTGDNDLVVSVETTRLAGAADFAVLPVVHTLMMDDKTVQQYTLAFLEHGYFISADRRQPIPRAAQ